MNARDSRRRLYRLGMRFSMLMVLAMVVVGCGGNSVATNGPISADNPKTGARRKEARDFMKTLPSGGTSISR